MWYWYVLGIIVFFIMLFIYSSLVVAGRTDDCMDALEREENSDTHSRGSDPEMEPCLNANSKKGKLLLPARLFRSLTKMNRFSIVARQR